jgi:hypothetical protein
MPETAVYGYCPTCGRPGIVRARDMVGTTACENGHEWEAGDGLPSPPAQSVLPDADQLRELVLDYGHKCMAFASQGHSRCPKSMLDAARNALYDAHAALLARLKESEEVSAARLAALEAAEPDAFRWRISKTEPTDATS